MEGQGYYNRHSRPQAIAASFAYPLLERAAAAVPLPSGTLPVVIADYGASQGHNSLEPMGLAIATLRRRLRAARPILVAHTDQPGNDFSSLFDLLETAPDSYLRRAPNVYAYAAGRSFYTGLFPAGCVVLGWCSIAVH